MSSSCPALQGPQVLPLLQEVFLVHALAEAGSDSCQEGLGEEDRGERGTEGKGQECG